MRFYKLAPADVVVIYDEIDLPPGKVRVKTGGGTAGHNGLPLDRRRISARSFGACASASAIRARRSW